MKYESVQKTLPPKIIVWYDRNIRFWTAIYQDDIGNQIGNAGYGMSKAYAIEDVKYQAGLTVNVETI
jgi:hypothetical protein